VVRIDNIKGSYDSAFIEALITSPVISGHRLYHGEASRPNTLTFVLTGNSLRLSRDIADRAFIIRLARPIYRPEWEDELYTYLAEHRDRILADVVAELQGPSASCFARDRYAEWVKDVLARAGGDTDAVVSLNKERRGECDEELEEAGLIMEAIDEHIARIRSARIEREGYVEDARFAFITSTEMTELMRDALKEKLSAKAVKRRIEGHIQAVDCPMCSIAAPSMPAATTFTWASKEAGKDESNRWKASEASETTECSRFHVRYDASDASVYSILYRILASFRGAGKT